MIAWRVLLDIKSTRYASGLIYPFAVLAAQGIPSYRKKEMKRNYVFFFMGLIFLFFAILWINKNYNVKQCNSSLKNLAEIHDLYAAKGKSILFTKSDEALRIKRMEKGNNPVIIYYQTETNENLKNYLEEYRTINETVLLDVVSNSKNREVFKHKYSFSSVQRVMTFHAQRNKKKWHDIYKIVSDAYVQVLHSNKTIEPESGILINGDLERLDDPELSYKKLNDHIQNYSKFFEPDPSVRTPHNAYYHNSAVFTENLPYYNTLNSYAISGNNSAFIKTQKGVCYILFSQKNQSGKYNYSFLLTGKKDTKVCILYDLNKNKKWSVISLGEFTIPEKRLYKINSTFEISGLKSDDYFFVGAWVSNGEVYLDNFCLRKEKQ